MKKVLLLVAIMFMSLQLFAQKTVSGVVLDEEGFAIPGVGIVIKGTTDGEITNFEGKYSIDVPKNAILVFSFIGYQTQEIDVTEKSIVNITLKVGDKEITEVVVTAYGTATKSSLVGAQLELTSKDIERRPITNITSALSGSMSGIQVLSSGGQPGSSSSIIIRGYGSMNASSKPIYVVDGSIYDGAISDIPSQDIKSVSILKDAASTALYGSSAGNGVILITTKNGEQAEKGEMSFNFVTNQGISKRGVEDYDKVGIMDMYTTRWQQWYNQQKYSNGKSDEYAAAMAAKDVLTDLEYNPYDGIKSYYERYVDGGEVKFRITDNPTSSPSNHWLAVVMPNGTLNPEVSGLLYGDDLDWEDALLRTGFRSEYNINGSYRTDKIKSFVSFGYLNEKGYRIETGLKRFTGRVNLNYKVNKYVSIGTNLSGSKADIDYTRGSSGIGFISEMAPIYPIHAHNPDGTYVLDEDGNKIYDRDGRRPYNGRYNPIEQSYLDMNNTQRDALASRSYLSINILPSLKFTTNISYDLYSTMNKKRYNKEMGQYAGQGFLVMSNLRSTTVNFNQLLNFTKDFGNHHLNILAGHESYQRHSVSSSLSKRGIQLTGIDEMSNLIETDDLSSGTGNYRKEGYFGRINYDFAYKYNLSASYRHDGTSRLHPDCRWGDFWSVGVAWILKKESFLEGANWLDDLKLRLSIGQTGNDGFKKGKYIDNYAYQTLYSLGRNNNERLGLRLQSYADETLKWETQTSSDIALEFGLFQRIRATVELFNKESKDLIFSFPLPTSTGIGSIDKNLGKVRNYGIESSLEIDIIRRGRNYLAFNINATHLKNEIVTLPEENREDGIELTRHKYMEGKSKYEYYLKEWIGVDPEDGLAIYRLDKEEYPDEPGLEDSGEKATWTKEGKFAKKHFCGSAIPTVYGGFGLKFLFNNLDFNANFAYQLGGKTYDSGYQGLMGRSLAAGMAMHKDMLKAWRKPGDKTDIPRLDAGTAGEYDASTSDRFLISRNALMFKSVSVGYTLSNEWTAVAKVRNVRISISAENLFLFSKRKGLDPMGSYNGVYSGAGYNYQKTIVGSLSFSF